MRTTLTLDEGLVESVISITQVSNRSEAIRIALSGYIKMKNKEKLLAMRGQVDIEDNWQALRQLECTNE
jgi:metal-responsive CopG/Arc/MetJ family transcriptional regulator